MSGMTPALHNAIQAARQQADGSNNPPLRRGELLREIFGAFKSGGSSSTLSEAEINYMKEIDGDIDYIIADSAKELRADGRH